MVELQTEWSWLIAIYLFLGGLGAGAFCTVAVVTLFTGERFKSTIRFGAWASVICISVGVLSLLVHVGQPLRALVLFKSFVNLDSWMTRGAWFLFFAILFDGLFALFWTDLALNRMERVFKPLVTHKKIWRLILAVLGIVVNIGVAVYTGILLNVLPFRPFWHTELLPVLFTVSALDTGLGLITAYATLRERANGVERLRTILELFVIVLIIAEGGVIAYYLQTMLGGSTDAIRSAQVLVNGVLSPFFWVLVVGLGLGVPLLVCLIQLTGLGKRIPPLVGPITAITSCLIGGFTLRTVMLLAGLPAMLSAPSLHQILANVRFVP